MVKWSACSPSIPMIQVQIPLKSQFSCTFVVEKNENIQKEAGVGPFEKQQSVKFKIIKENRDSTEVQFKVNRSEEGKLHYRFKYNTLIDVSFPEAYIQLAWVTRRCPR